MKKPLILALTLAALLSVSCGGKDGAGDVTENTTTAVTTETPDTTDVPDTTDTEATTAVTEGDTDVTVLAADMSLDISEFEDAVQRWGSGNSCPMVDFRLEVTGLDYPVILHIEDSNYVVAVEAFGYTHPTSSHQLYGNCGHDLFSAEGAVIFQWDYYDIGSSYILTPDGCSELHLEDVASPHLYITDDGDLRYKRTHNRIAGISQTGPLSYVTSYDELYVAHGDAWIENGQIVLGEADDVITMDEAYDLDRHFSERSDYNTKYATLEDLFEANRKRLEEYGY